MYFSEPRAHAVPFISSKIVPLQMLYAEKVSSIMFDVSSMNAPSNICDFFTKANIQSTSMRPGFLRLEIIMSKLQD